MRLFSSGRRRHPAASFARSSRSPRQTAAGRVPPLAVTTYKSSPPHPLDRHPPALLTRSSTPPLPAATFAAGALLPQSHGHRPAPPSRSASALPLRPPPRAAEPVRRSPTETPTGAAPLQWRRTTPPAGPLQHRRLSLAPPPRCVVGLTARRRRSNRRAPLLLFAPDARVPCSSSLCS